MHDAPPCLGVNDAGNNAHQALLPLRFILRQRLPHPVAGPGGHQHIAAAGHHYAQRMLSERQLLGRKTQQVLVEEMIVDAGELLLQCLFVVEREILST